MELWDAENRGEKWKALSIITTATSRTAFCDYKLSESTRPALNVKKLFSKEKYCNIQWLNILKYFHEFYQLATNVDILKHLLWNEVNIKWNLGTYIFHSHLLENHHSYYSSISQ